MQLFLFFHLSKRKDHREERIRERGKKDSFSALCWLAGMKLAFSPFSQLLQGRLHLLVPQHRRYLPSSDEYSKGLFSSSHLVFLFYDQDLFLGGYFVFIKYFFKHSFICRSNQARLLLIHDQDICYIKDQIMTASVSNLTTVLIMTSLSGQGK